MNGALIEPALPAYEAIPPVEAVSLHVGDDSFPKHICSLDRLTRRPFADIPLYEPVDVAIRVRKPHSFPHIRSSGTWLRSEVDELVDVEGFTHIQLFKHTEGGDMTTINRIRNLYWKMKRIWWGLRGVPIGSGGSMFSKFGKGEFVDVRRRHGGIIDITSHKGYPGARAGTVRIIPYQPNHGFMVERWENGKLSWRDSVDYRDLVTRYHEDEASH